MTLQSRSIWLLTNQGLKRLQSSNASNRVGPVLNDVNFSYSKQTPFGVIIIPLHITTPLPGVNLQLHFKSLLFANRCEFGSFLLARGNVFMTSSVLIIQTDTYLQWSHLFVQSTYQKGSHWKGPHHWPSPLNVPPEKERKQLRLYWTNKRTQYSCCPLYKGAWSPPSVPTEYKNGKRPRQDNSAYSYYGPGITGYMNMNTVYSVHSYSGIDPKKAAFVWHPVQAIINAKLTKI